MKQGLAIHTTSGELGLAINNEEQKYRFQSWDLGKDLANNLQEKIIEFLPPLTWKNIDFLAVAKGPGSFTSTRIGIVTAKTIAQQLNIPVIGISTLESFAWYHSKEKENQSLIAVEMKANSEEVFASIYQLVDRQQELINIMVEKVFIRQEWENIKAEYKANYQEKFDHFITPDKLAFTTPDLLKLAIIKLNKIDNKCEYNWQNLTPFYR